MLKNDFTIKYKNGITNELLQDELTIEKLQRWEDNVFPISDFIDICEEAVRVMPINWQMLSVSLFILQHTLIL